MEKKQWRRARWYVYGMVRRMQNGFYIGTGVLIVAFTLYRSAGAAVGVPLILLALALLAYTALRVFQARLLLHRLERSGEAWKIYEEIERPSCIDSPQTNTVVTDDYVLATGGKKGMEIVRYRDVVKGEVYTYAEGKTREIRLTTRDGVVHYVAFYHNRSGIPAGYDEVVTLLRQRLGASVFP